MRADMILSHVVVVISVVVVPVNHHSWFMYSCFFDALIMCVHPSLRML